MYLSTYTGSIVFLPGSVGCLLHFGSQFCASLEFHSLACGNLNLGLCGGIDACTGAFFRNRECTESYKCDLVALCESFGNSVECSVKSIFSIYLGQACLFGNGGNEFSFIND